MSSSQQVLLGLTSGGGAPSTVAAAKRPMIFSLNRHIRHLTLAYPATIPGVKVRLNVNSGVLVTESGDGTAGWNYAGVGNTSFDESACTASTQKLASGVNGFCSTVLAASGDLSARAFVFGFYLTQVVTNFQAPVAAIGGGGNVYEQYDQYVSNAPNGVSGMSIANGHIVRLSRSGTTILAEVSTTGGLSWVTIHTFSGASTADLYIHAFVSGSVHCNNISSDVMA